MQLIVPILSLLIVAVLGFSCLDMPFTGDQALFTLSAMKMANGELLYKDFWDIKQPAIFFFYLIAGKLFSFSEHGIHLLELLYMLSFSIVLLITLRKYFHFVFFLSLVPLLSVGVYYSFTGAWHFTQVEALIGFPIYLSVWALSERHFLLAGLMAGIVVLFKLFYLPLVVVLWIPLLFTHREGFIKLILSFFTLPFLLVLYYLYRGEGEILYKTTFVYPMMIAAMVHQKLLSFSGLKWFLKQFYPLILLSFIGSFRAVKDPFLLCLLLWIPMGLVSIHFQFEQWEYHYLLIFVPLGILSALALDTLWGGLKGYLFLALAIYFLIPLYENAIPKLKHLFNNQSDITNFQDQFGNYNETRTDVAFLHDPKAKQGKIYVFGSPLIYWLSHREQGPAIHGWAIDRYPPDLWNWLHSDLMHHPPAYIYMPEGTDKTLSYFSPKTLQLIQQNYHPYKKSWLEQN